MPAYVGLLRAVNVGGTGRLPMADLVAMCRTLGFAEVRTYIASGNVVFASGDDEAGVKAALEGAMATYAGKPVGVMVRTAAELAAVRDANPWPDAPGNRDDEGMGSSKLRIPAAKTGTARNARTVATLAAMAAGG